jgi:putative nucleotidyltransferase with HDIG domain
MKQSTLVRGVIFLATCFGVWGVLSIGAGADSSTLEVGALADQTYEAQRADEVEDTVETGRLEREARDRVDPIMEDNSQTEQDVLDSVTALFDDLESSVIGEAPEPGTDPTLPSSTTSTTNPEETTSTSTPPDGPVVLTGLVFLDVDGDGVFTPDAEVNRPDRGLERISVTITSATGEETVMSGAGGAWSYETGAGDHVVKVDVNDADIPNGFFVSETPAAELLACERPGEECVATAVGFAPGLAPLEDVATRISTTHQLAADASATLVAIAADDVIRSALGLLLHLPTVEQEVISRISQEFFQGIESTEVTDVRLRARNNPPTIYYLDGTSPDEEGTDAAGEIVATLILPNREVNEEATKAAQDQAAAAVEPVFVEYTAGQLIVDQNQPLTQLHIDAISATGANPGEVEQEGGLLAVVAVLIGILGLYLATFRLEFWARPRMVALLAILVVLAAAAVRGTVIAEPGLNWYVLPAVAFGFVTAILFDSRIAVLMALTVGVVAAVGTQDIGVSVYAVLATMAPIPFVSSVSSRGAFRNAVIFSSFTAAVAAAATSWFFHVGANDSMLEVVRTSSAWAFGVSVVASLVGLAALQFFESAFDITTTLSLLDLTDRNHEALQLLQEEAFGSFNHSLMVGTLSHAAARAINGNALLARAMAYYHDLGKTENPTYFIENQFGGSNPHDLLSPKESAEIIRRHVTDGVALARQYKIPSDVTMGIVSHHGDGIMRFFYEKAKSQENGEVDPDDFRHVGHKPRTAESAIVMLADSLEAACRAEFQTQEASPLAIEKVVDRVINEKMDDGQLSESPLTLSDITKIRAAFLESLIGHYHQRIAYPNFPGS